MTAETVTPDAYNPAAAWTASGSIADLAPAFTAALGELEDVPRERTARIDSQRGGSSYQYRYADLGDVLTASRPILAKHDLGAFQVPVVTADAVEVTTTIVHASGQWIRFHPLRLPAGGTAQTIGSAITYARRYSVMAALGLATDDDDGQAASRQRESSESAEPLLLPQRAVDLFRQRAGEHGWDLFDTEAIVRDATNGRTSDIEAVRNDEIDALAEAVTRRMARDDAEAVTDG